MKTFELAEVRDFAAALDRRMAQCDNGEGMLCNTVEEKINHYVALCRDLRECINQWARSVFRAEIKFDADVEAVLRQEATSLLRHAKPVAALGRQIDGECFGFGALGELHCRLADLDFLLENWVSPQRSVSPAPRVRLTESAAREMKDRMAALVK